MEWACPTVNLLISELTHFERIRYITYHLVAKQIVQFHGRLTRFKNELDHKLFRNKSNQHANKAPTPIKEKEQCDGAKPPKTLITGERIWGSYMYSGGGIYPPWTLQCHILPKMASN